MRSYSYQSWCKLRPPNRWYEHLPRPSPCVHDVGVTFSGHNIDSCNQLQPSWSNHLQTSLPPIFLLSLIYAPPIESTFQTTLLTLKCCLCSLLCLVHMSSFCISAVLPPNFEILEANFSLFVRFCTIHLCALLMQYLSDHDVDHVKCFRDLRCEECTRVVFSHGV